MEQYDSTASPLVGISSIPSNGGLEESLSLVNMPTDTGLMVSGLAHSYHSPSQLINSNSLGRDISSSPLYRSAHEIQHDYVSNRGSRFKDRPATTGLTKVIPASTFNIDRRIENEFTNNGQMLNDHIPSHFRNDEADNGSGQDKVQLMLQKNLSTMDRAKSAGVTRRRGDPSFGNKPKLTRIRSAPLQRIKSSRPCSSIYSDAKLCNFQVDGCESISAVASPRLEKVKVAIRIRPLNKIERLRGDKDILEVQNMESNQVILLSKSTRGVAVPAGAVDGFDAGLSFQRKFSFNCCLGPQARQSEVIKLCGVKKMLDAVLEGQNAVIFAYGQTGSGKTYTIYGGMSPESESEIETPWDELLNEHSNPLMPQDEDMNQSFCESDGIVPRSVEYIFQKIENKNSEFASEESKKEIENPIYPSNEEGKPVYSLSASYCEIYNEGIYDLLNVENKQLSLRWDPNRSFYAPDLYVHECSSISDIYEVVNHGLRHRRVGSHNLNSETSRSHSLLTIYVTRTASEKDTGQNTEQNTSKIVFVDLAGSERIKNTGSCGEAVKETANINRSLFMLGKVIAALENGASGALVPYRESKLTKLLMDCLGGNSLCLMIACCSPSSESAEETLKTLNFAARAKNIQNTPGVYLDPRQAATLALEKEIQFLRLENTILKQQLSSLTSRNNNLNKVQENPQASYDQNEVQSYAIDVINERSSIGLLQQSPLPSLSYWMPIPHAANTSSHLQHILNNEGFNSLPESRYDAQRICHHSPQGAVDNSMSNACGPRHHGRTDAIEKSSNLCFSETKEDIEWVQSKLAKLNAKILNDCLPDKKQTHS